MVSRIKWPKIPMGFPQFSQKNPENKWSYDPPCNLTPRKASPSDHQGMSTPAAEECQTPAAKAPGMSCDAFLLGKILLEGLI